MLVWMLAPPAGATPAAPGVPSTAAATAASVTSTAAANSNPTPTPVPFTPSGGVAWGSDEFDQLGAETPADLYEFPVPVQPGELDDERFTDVVAGENFSCGLGTDTSVYCWGANESGQLGNGQVSEETTAEPERVLGGEQGEVFLENIRLITAGSFFVCAVDTNAQVFCWGANDRGQLGAGPDGAMEEPLPVRVVAGEQPGEAVLAGVVDIASGWGDSTCAIIGGGSVYCWGNNAKGQLGNGTGGQGIFSDSPVRVLGGEQGGQYVEEAVAVSTASHACVTTESENVFCWGFNGAGQLGDGTLNDSTEPVQVLAGATDEEEEFLGNARDVANYANGTCAVIGFGVACWGSGSQGELGNGQKGIEVYATEPVWVLSGEQRTGGAYLVDINEIAAGFAHVCALDASSGAAFCWGWNQNGQLGNGDAGDDADRAEPVRVLGLDEEGTLRQVTSIDGGFRHSVATLLPPVQLTTTDIFSWGDNGYLEMANPAYPFNSADYPIPAIPGAATDEIFTSVAAGGFHTCAVTDDSEVFCWGLNGDGQAGIGTTEPVKLGEPTQVVGGAQGGEFLSEVVAVSAGAFHTCAVTNPGDIFCWGANTSGQLGDGTFEGSAAPVQVLAGEQPGGGAFATGLGVTGGGNFTCAWTESAEAYCWGNNKLGQLGNGEFAPPDAVPTPVQVVAGEQSQTQAAAADDKAPLVDVRQVAAGSATACAVAGANESFCWGEGELGQLGNGKSAEEPVSNVPVRTLGVDGDGVLDDVIEVAVGEASACAVLSGSANVVCWGDNEFGQLGNDQAPGTEVLSDVPVQTLDSSGLGPLEFISQVVVGSTSACALEERGFALCWGANGAGQLGASVLPSNEFAALPMPVVGPNGEGTLFDIDQMSLGNTHVAAIVQIAPDPGAGFVPIDPVRVYDSRQGAGPIAGGDMRQVPLGAAIPENANPVAVAYNLTITGTSGTGYLSVAPGNFPVPPIASTINWTGPNQTMANSYVVGVDAATVNVFAGGGGSTQFTFDVLGYYEPVKYGVGAAGAAGDAEAPVVSAAAEGDPSPMPAGLTTLNPVRAYDSRDIGAGGPLAGGSSRTVNVTAAGAVPPQAVAVAYTLTMTGTKGTGYLSVAPAGGEQPDTSLINWTGSNQTMANSSQVGISDGAVTVYAGGSGSTGFVVDVLGYFVQDAFSMYFTPVTPARSYDSRFDTPGGPLGAGENRTTSLMAGAVPEDADAVAFNLTITGTTASGYLTATPGGSIAAPVASTINWTASRQTRANGTLVGVDELDEVSDAMTAFAGGGATQYITDVGGYYQFPTFQ